MDISLELSMFLWISIWISMNIHALTSCGFSILGRSVRLVLTVDSTKFVDLCCFEKSYLMFYKLLSS